MLAGAFPLVTDAMFHRMTFAGASSFLGGVAALLTIVPWVLVFFGTRIRARSKFAKVCARIFALFVKDVSSLSGVGNHDGVKKINRQSWTKVLERGGIRSGDTIGEIDWSRRDHAWPYGKSARQKSATFI